MSQASQGCENGRPALQAIDLGARAWQYRAMKELRQAIRRIVFWAVVLGLLVLAIKQFPGRDKAALDAFDKGDYSTAARFWEKLSRTGDVEAQFKLGMLYAQGLGVERDPRKAHELLLAAAEAGNPAAQYVVARDYRYGIGTGRSPKVALMWLRESADRDFAPAQIALGRLYLSGDGVRRDPKQADYWLGKAERLRPDIMTGSDIAPR